MGTAASALFYLWWRSFVNVVLARLRRLRQPKYLIGAVLAVGYLYFVFLSPFVGRDGGRAGRPGELPPAPLDPNLLTLFLSVLLPQLFAAMWLWRRQRTALQFSEAEIAYLFPGPVSHHALVHYSLIRGQAALLFSALFMTLISARWPFLASPFWARFVGWWLVTSVITLHITASGFVMTRLLARGVAQWQRQVAVAALLVLVGWVTAMLNPHLHLPVPNETAGLAAIRTYMESQFGEGVLYWMLFPFRALAAPLVAPTLTTFLQALPAALLVYGLHYLWAFLVETPDPEGALAKAEKRAAVVQAMRKGNWRAATMQPAKSRPDPFKLSAHGTPIVAFLWKNLLSTREYLNVRTALALAALIIGWRLWLNTQSPDSFIGVIPTLVAFMLGAQTLLVGAQFARQDLRSDLENADLLKIWPLAGWQIVLGELLTPTLILTCVLWLCLLHISMVPAAPRFTMVTPELRVIGGLSAALVLPFLCAVQLLVANSAAVLFPAWLKSSGGVQNQGLEVVGQRLLFFAGQMFIMIVALVPALLLGVLVYVPASWFIDSFALLPAALMVVLVLAGELAWGINWLGERFDAYDLSS